jgi:hypothetical protein
MGIARRKREDEAEYREQGEGDGGYISGLRSHGGPTVGSSAWKMAGSRGCWRAIKIPPGVIMSAILCAQDGRMEGERAQRN